MLKIALMELIIKKGYKIYFEHTGNTISYDIKKSELYYNEHIISINSLEKTLDESLNFLIPIYTQEVK